MPLLKGAPATTMLLLFLHILKNNYSNILPRFQGRLYIYLHLYHIFLLDLYSILNEGQEEKELLLFYHIIATIFRNFTRKSSDVLNSCISLYLSHRLYLQIPGFFLYNRDLSIFSKDNKNLTLSKL